MPRSTRPMIAGVLVGLMLMSFAGGAVLAQDPSPARPAVDTDGWTQHAMPFLGYTLLLPPEFERVSDDPDAPVPSSADIAARDPQTAAALQVAAQRSLEAGGLFDGLGLWSVEPASLLQLGVLAGTPYRMTPADLGELVGQSVQERASELEDPVIQPISVPAGDGFLATYLASTDLAQHREVHLRTPTGRYLILATSLPGIADPALEQMVLAIAESLRAIPGSAADAPAPANTPAEHADPDLESTLPERLAGIDLTRRSLGGETLVSSVETVTGSIVGELGRLVDAPGDVSVALAVPTDTDAPLIIAAYRLRDVTLDQARAFVDSFPDEVWSDARIVGRDVRVSVVGVADNNRSWLHVAAGPDGDAVLYQVDAGRQALGLAAVAALP